jgi:hypothetical protein
MFVCGAGVGGFLKIKRLKLQSLGRYGEGFQKRGYNLILTLGVGLF